MTVAVDTDEPFVMERVLDAGVDIINDIDGFDTDEKLNIISAYKPAVVAMNNGRAGYPYSEELFDNLDQAFSKKKLELMECGLDPRQIAIDPGVGFF